MAPAAIGAGVGFWFGDHGVNSEPKQRSQFFVHLGGGVGGERTQATNHIASVSRQDT